RAGVPALRPRRTDGARRITDDPIGQLREFRSLRTDHSTLTRRRTSVLRQVNLDPQLCAQGSLESAVRDGESVRVR
ncbi:hypothetical protein, partial [Nocardia cyriacigeorgica]|uniref:hypothetical protein n=1 Tax=Nocardia cyriacigeorgica TaxID=135487 RepID=UPI0024587163